jgi:hypothetical protein
VWPPGPFWTGAEDLAPTGIRSPDRPARSESLYQIRSPGPKIRKLQEELMTSALRYVGPLFYLRIVGCLLHLFTNVVHTDLTVHARGGIAAGSDRR